MQGGPLFDTPRAAMFSDASSEPLMDLDTPGPALGSARAKREADGDLLPTDSSGKRQHLAPLSTPRDRIGRPPGNDDTDLLLTDEKEVIT